MKRLISVIQLLKDAKDEARSLSVKEIERFLKPIRASSGTCTKTIKCGSFNRPRCSMSVDKPFFYYSQKGFLALCISKIIQLHNRMYFALNNPIGLNSLKWQYIFDPKYRTDCKTHHAVPVEDIIWLDDFIKGGMKFA